MELTRREILTALLGLPIASGCKRAAWAPTWEGSFVDRSMELGHRLRDGAPTVPSAAGAPEEVPVLILGAGIAGLAAGWQLQRRGFSRFLLLDLEDEVGGTARSGRSDVTAFPWGAHYVPAPRATNADLVELFLETGSISGRDPQGELVYSETHLCAAPKERIYFRGLWQPGLFPREGARAADLEQLDRFEQKMRAFAAAKDASGRRAFDIPIARSSDDRAQEALDQQSMGEWLSENGFDSPLLRWYVDYACRDDFGTELNETSAWYGIHYFASRIEPCAGRTTEPAEVLTWPAGNGYLVDHLARKVSAARIRNGMLVTSVRPEGDGRRARVAVFDIAQNRPQVFIAERVILALPSFLRSRILEGFDGVQEIRPRYVPWLVANLHLDRRPESNGFPVAWDNVIYQSRSLGYVVATHQGDRGTKKTVWTYYLPLTRADEKSERRSLASLSYQEATDAIVHELSACHTDFVSAVKRIDVMRWGHAMVRPAVGSAFSRERSAAARAVGPVHFAHTDLSGVALFEEAFFHGLRAANEVLTALRR